MNCPLATCYTCLIMKYCVLIIDGAAGWPIPERGGKTCLQLAHTPHLDCLAREGMVGLVRTVPQGMEPSSACACMSIMGYDPRVYYQGRSAIEALSMGIPVEDGDALFRCNLVAVRDGRMWDYSTGHIESEDAHVLMEAIQEGLASEEVQFYPGVSFRSICKIRRHPETLRATCSPPHDIAGEPIAEHLPRGEGSELLRHLMLRSQEVLEGHPLNAARQSRGQVPAAMIWLFWGSSKTAAVPSFRERFGVKAAMTSGVDLLGGLARLSGMDMLDIAGVTDSLDNDYAAQMEGALGALEEYDLVVVHVEATDEAGHAGSIEDKVAAIESVDREMVARLLPWRGRALRVVALPDHPTPIATKAHSADPVPFVLWGPGVAASGATGFDESEAGSTAVFIEEGHTVMDRLIGGF